MGLIIYKSDSSSSANKSSAGFLATAAVAAVGGAIGVTLSFSSKISPVCFSLNL